MLHAAAHGLGLQELGSVDQGVQVPGIQVMLGQVVQDLAVGGRIALMLLHDIGEDVPVRGQGEAFNGLHLREGLEPELGHKPERVVAVGLEGLIAVPDAPVVHIPALFVRGLVKGAAGAGRGGAIGPVRVQNVQQGGQDILKDLDIVRLLLRRASEPVLAHGRLVLVVPAPKREARVMAQAQDIVPELGADVLLKGGGELIPGTGEHEVLPDQESELITGVKEEVIGIVAAAPDAHTVEVRIPAVLQQAAGALGRDAAQDIVLGDIVGTHAEHGHAVDAKAEGRAVLVRGFLDVNGAQADALFPAVEKHAFRAEQVGLQGIQGLVAQTVGPPETRGHDLHGRVRGGHDLIAVRVQERVAQVQAFGRRLARQVQVRGEVQLHHARGVGLADEHRADLGRGHGPEIDGPEDAGVGQTRTPVPAVHAVGLADVREAADGVRAPVHGTAAVGGVRGLHRRAEQDGE